jgi:hypothetical protein
MKKVLIVGLLIFCTIIWSGCTRKIQSIAGIVTEIQISTENKILVVLDGRTTYLLNMRDIGRPMKVGDHIVISLKRSALDGITYYKLESNAG